MKTHFRKSFSRDLKKLNDATVLKRVQTAIEELESVQQLSELANVKKMSGGGNFYRIRIGDYRIGDYRLGIVLEDDTVELVRCLHRRDIYRYFP